MPIGYVYVRLLLPPVGTLQFSCACALPPHAVALVAGTEGKGKGKGEDKGYGTPKISNITKCFCAPFLYNAPLACPGQEGNGPPNGYKWYDPTAGSISLAACEKRKSETNAACGVTDTVTDTRMVYNPP